MPFNIFADILEFLGFSQQQTLDAPEGEIPAVFTSGPVTLKLQIQDADSLDKPREHDLQTGEYWIGEAADRTIRVRSEQAGDGTPRRGFVSGRHCCIRVGGEGLASIQDTDSTNGTYVNNKKIGAEPLLLRKPPVEIRLGGVEEPGLAPNYAAKPRICLLFGESAAVNLADGGALATPIAPQLKPAILVQASQSYALLPGDLPYTIGRSERCKVAIPAVYLGVPHQHLSIERFTEHGALTRIVTNWYGGKSASVHLNNRLVENNPFVWTWDGTVELARNAKGKNNVTCSLSLKRPGGPALRSKP
jgi:hypothetical protein